MGAVSKREYLRHASGEAEDQEARDAVAAHQHEGPQADPPPVPGARRPWSARSAGRPARGRPPAARPEMREQGSEKEHSPGRALGIPEFPQPLPGSDRYLVKDAAEPHQPLDVGPAKPYYSGGLAHGVPAPVEHGGRPTARHEDRAEIEASRREVRELTREPADPIPVYVVEKSGGTHPLQRAAFYRKQVPAAGGDPVMIVPKDPRRTSVRLLNEAAAGGNIIRMHAEPGGAATGPALPAAMTGYLEIDTQDEIWALTDAAGTGATFLSVISQYDVPSGA
jgi:hypothetical protein